MLHICIDGLQYNAMSAMLEVYNKRIFYSSNCWLQPAWVGDIVRRIPTGCSIYCSGLFRALFQNCV